MPGSATSAGARSGVRGRDGLALVVVVEDGIGIGVVVGSVRGSRKNIMDKRQGGSHEII